MQFTSHLLLLLIAIQNNFLGNAKFLPPEGIFLKFNLSATHPKTRFPQFLNRCFLFRKQIIHWKTVFSYVIKKPF